MSLVQRFAQVFGAVYLLVGLTGFLPPLLLGSLPAEVLGPLKGLQLGVFAVNWFHSLAHLLIGAAGLAVYRSYGGSKAYALALGVGLPGAVLARDLLGQRRHPRGAAAAQRPRRRPAHPDGPDSLRRLLRGPVPRAARRSQDVGGGAPA